MKINWKLLAVAFAAVFLAAAIGSTFTDTGTWYQQNKPSITPPNFVFPIVWTILFVMIAVSIYVAYPKAKDKKILASAYGANLFFNVMWSYLFFSLKNPFAALIDIFLLIASTAYLILLDYKTNKTAAYLLIPYLLWICFAAILNYLFL